MKRIERPIVIDVTGPLALFTRPEFKTERYSYDVITPEACAGILKAIFWHPPVEYEIVRIHVLNKIRHTTIRTNEVRVKGSLKDMCLASTREGAAPHIDPVKERTQRMSTMLADVHYVIEAYMLVNEKKLRKASKRLNKPAETPEKFIRQLERRLKHGECFRQPCLGIRELACAVKPCLAPTEPVGYYANAGKMPLGTMHYRFEYQKDGTATPSYYKPVMENGTIQVAGCRVYR